MPSLIRTSSPIRKNKSNNMKKFLLAAMYVVALSSPLLFTSCDDDEEDEPKVELRTLTFEDKDYKGTGNFLGKSDWSSLIDNPQYGGDLLYGTNAAKYKWYDEDNTGLRFDGFKEAWGAYAFYNGGYAISNYYDPTLSSDYTKQLAIPLTETSNNFCVAYGASQDGTGSQAPDVNPIYFSDGVARTIKSIDVINTMYTAASLSGGDSYTPAATANTKFTVHILGTHADGTTAEVTYDLCSGTNILKNWATVDCTALGKVTKIQIFVSGSSDLVGSYGLNTPSYCAFDNVVVEF